MPQTLSAGDAHLLLAVEYVIGTLEAGERRSARELIEADPHFSHLVRQWEAILTPLHELAAPVAPPPELWRSIQKDLPSDLPIPKPFVFMEKTPVQPAASTAAAGASDGPPEVPLPIASAAAAAPEPRVTDAPAGAPSAQALAVGEGAGAAPLEEGAASDLRAADIAEPAAAGSGRGGVGHFETPSSTPVTPASAERSAAEIIPGARQRAEPAPVHEAPAPPAPGAPALDQIPSGEPLPDPSAVQPLPAPAPASAPIAVTQGGAPTGVGPPADAALPERDAAVAAASAATGSTAPQPNPPPPIGPPSPSVSAPPAGHAARTSACAEGPPAPPANAGSSSAEPVSTGLAAATPCPAAAAGAYPVPRRGGLALAAGLVALLAGIGAFAVSRLWGPAGEVHLIALLQKEPAPAVALRFNPTSGVLTVRALAPAPPPGKTHYLWLLEGQRAHFLGAFAASAVIRSDALGALDAATLRGASVCVTLEDEGAPVAAGPTGEVLYSGRFILEAP